MVVVSSILLSYLIGLDKYDVDILGKISDSSFPAPYPPEITSVEVLRKGITPAVAISLLGFLGNFYSYLLVLSCRFFCFFVCIVVNTNFFSPQNLSL